MSVFFLSDLHLGHRKVAETRGFGSVETHDETLAANWRSAIKSDDIVWVLGDTCAGSGGAWRHALSILADLPGRKRLVNGNHDPTAGFNRRAHRHQAQALEVFEQVSDYARIRLQVDGASREVLLSHYPYAGVRDDHTAQARYLEYRLADHGYPLLHGHTHLADQRFTASLAGTPQVHVGVDAWGLSPVPAERIAAILSHPSAHRRKVDHG